MREHKYIHTVRTNVSLEDMYPFNVHVVRVYSKLDLRYKSEDFHLGGIMTVT